MMQGLFSIDSNGVITFNSAPDFETPSDSDTDNVYKFIASAEDNMSNEAKPEYHHNYQQHKR